MHIRHIRRSLAVVSVGIVALMPLIASAWTGPSGSPPNNNVSAPINVGTIDQVKNAGIGVNSLAVFGNSLLGGAVGSNAYLNFGGTAGTGGYGMRDKDGTMQFKNLGETAGDNGWRSFQTIVFDFVGGSASWAVNGNHIHNTNTGNVGIGTQTPGAKLEVNGLVKITGGTPGAGKVLTSNSAGLASWAPAPNYGISSIATVNDVPKLGGPNSLVDSLIYATDDGVGIGNLTPRELGNGLDVHGTIAVDTASNIGVVDFTHSPWNITSGAPGTGGGVIGWNKSNGQGEMSFVSLSCCGGADGGFSFYDKNTQLVRIMKNGNVGIGTASSTYKLQLSTDSAGKPNGGSWANSSDQRLKKNIAPITDGLQRLMKLQPVSFDWRNPSLHGGIAPSGGFIAQNVMREFPSWVTQIPCAGADCALVGGTPSSKAYSLTLPFEYDAMVVSAIQEMNAKIDAQQAEIESQNKKIDSLMAEIEALKAAR